jgi:hypothetical protein
MFFVAAQVLKDPLLVVQINYEDFSISSLSKGDVLELIKSGLQSF